MPRLQPRHLRPRRRVAHLQPERRNRVKVLLFLDVGGSMDPHVQVCEELFSAAKSEFRHLEHFYFHNCVYDHVWRDNHRRRNERFSTLDLVRTYGPNFSRWRDVFSDRVLPDAVNDEYFRALKESQTRLELQQTELERTNQSLEEQTQLLEGQKDATCL